MNEKLKKFLYMYILDIPYVKPKTLEEIEKEEQSVTRNIQIHVHRFTEEVEVQDTDDENILDEGLGSLSEEEIPEILLEHVMRIIDICDGKHLTSSLTMPVSILMDLLDQMEQTRTTNEIRNILKYEGWQNGQFSREPNMKGIKLNLIATMNLE